MAEAVQPGFAGRVGRMRRLYRLVIWLGLGGAAALGQAPWDLWPLTLIALGLLYALFRDTLTVRGAALLGWIAGTGYFMVALSWIIEPFLVDAARHGWMAPFALVGLSAYLAAFWGAAFGLARMAGGSALALVCAFTLGEAARGIFFTGFPWAQIGHVWITTPMLHWASWTGALGLSAAALATAIALWHMAAGHRRGGAVALVAIPALCLIPWLTAPDAPAPAGPVVRLIQPNAAQHEKWDPEMIPVFFNRQLDYTAAGEARPDLVVWPETSIPVVLNNAQDALSTIADAAGDVPVVVGAQRVEDGRLYNALAVLGPEGGISARYDKHHLVPFGEFVPFGDLLGRFGIAGIAARDGNGFSSGPGPQVVEIGDLGGALPLICYEGVFARNILGASARPDFLLMITNDAWFGEVSGPYQHLAQARLRSVEAGLPMIRVANTGISAMIDAQGQITHSLPLGQAGWVDAALPAPLPPTPYARLGDLPFQILLGLGILAAVLLRRRKAAGV